MSKTNKTKKQKINTKQHENYIVCFDYICYGLIVMKLEKIMLTQKRRDFIL